jgi:hypothetical protein
VSSDESLHLLLGLASAVILGSESRSTHGHNLLSPVWLGILFWSPVYSVGKNSFRQLLYVLRHSSVTAGLRVVRGHEKGSQFLGDINAGIWPSRFGGASDETVTHRYGFCACMKKQLIIRLRKIQNLVIGPDTRRLGRLTVGRQINTVTAVELPDYKFVHTHIFRPIVERVSTLFRA